MYRLSLEYVIGNLSWGLNVISILFLIITFMFLNDVEANSDIEKFIYDLYAQYDKNKEFDPLGLYADSIFSKELLDLIRLD